ncbi:MAG TPA: ABC transporter permease [Gemmatimonadaceae bacterium]|nr:ABC transporter permease [Gemmatimonadaceae bacterium]
MPTEPIPHVSRRARILAHAAFSLRTAMEAVGHNKLRAGLTSLGILFGVASVIAMLAIGRGAEQEIIEQMRLLGSNNVIVTPIVVQQEEKLTSAGEGEKRPTRYSPGLTYEDAQSIADVVPHVTATSGEIVLNTTLTREGLRRSGKVVGVDSDYFRLLNLTIASGTGWAASQVADGSPVAIIGYGVRTRFFTTEDPIGKPLKVGNVWLTVVGVLADRPVSAQTSQRLGIRDANMDVYVPTQTMLVRYRNRAELTQRDIEAASRTVTVTQTGDTTDAQTRAERGNRNQLDRIIVRVDDGRYMPAAADLIRRMLARRHNAVVDFEITVPELLLRQEQRTRSIFNVVLGAIASISLLVGGIGIMNIMLASVLERIREIGVRRATGATQRDILFQFLSEALLISVAGGVAGIITGAAISGGIQHFAGIKTIISLLSVVLAFGVSFTVGLVFGIVPAWRAAQQDPVVCLRYE